MDGKVIKTEEYEIDFSSVEGEYNLTLKYSLQSLSTSLFLTNEILKQLNEELMVKEDKLLLQLKMIYQSPLGKMMSRKSELIFPPFSPVSSDNSLKLLQIENKRLIEILIDKDKELEEIKCQVLELKKQISKCQQEILNYADLLAEKDRQLLSNQISNNEAQNQLKIEEDNPQEQYKQEMKSEGELKKTIIKRGKRAVSGSPFPISNSSEGKILEEDNKESNFEKKEIYTMEELQNKPKELNNKEDQSIKRKEIKNEGHPLSATSPPYQSDNIILLCDEIIKDNRIEIETINGKKYINKDLYYRVIRKGEEREIWERDKDLLPSHSALIISYEKDRELKKGVKCIQTILAKRLNKITREEEYKALFYSSNSSTWIPSSHIITPSLLSLPLPLFKGKDAKNEEILFPVSPFFDGRKKEIRERIGGKEFGIQWNIIRQFKPYGSADWSTFFSTDPLLFDSCNSVTDSTRILRTLLPSSLSKPQPKSNWMKERIRMRPQHLESQQEYTDYQYKCVIDFVNGKLKIELMELNKRMGCRMWRKWGSYRFLYITFLPTVPSRVIKRVCKEGIILHPLHHSYHFLFTKPIEREVIFFLENAEPCISSHGVREWHIEGEYNKKMNICKYNSRLSLGFSRSIPAGVIPWDETVEIDDEYGVEGDPSSIMTDGCSFISFSSLLTIQSQAQLHQVPSAVQGRYANTKGVWIPLPPTSSMKKLYKRKSQIKYNHVPSDDHQQTFELLQYSHEMGEGHLNRQYIQILESLGVPSQLFLEFQHEAISDLIQSLTTDPKRALLAVAGAIEGEGIEKKVCNFLLAGFDFQEPYLRQLIFSLIQHRLKKMKEKANIKVEKSRYLLMIPDPTGLLNEDEVFIQLSVSSTGKGSDPTVISSPVIVTRTPCHLPSDIRLLNAIDKFELRELKDVIVFSTKGSFSPASFMSGGDYDGDLAWVCWDPRFLSSFISSHDPPPPLLWSDPAITVDPTSNITLQKALGLGSSNYLNVPNLEKLMIKHFILQGENRLGELTNLHCRWAESKGLNHPTTIRIAQLCALAVDSAKSGVIISFSSRDAPPFPHYLKPSSNFTSTSALGKLFDDLDVNEIMNRIGKWWSNKTLSGPKSPLRLDDDLVLPNIPSHFLQRAEEWLSEYNHEIARILNSYPKYSPSSNAKCEELQEMMRNRYLEEATTVPDSLLFASAIYFVTRSKDVNFKQSARSFPWNICADRLQRLKSDAISWREENRLARTIASRHYSSIRYSE